MGPRVSQPVRKRILVWSSDGRGERELVQWLQDSGYDVVVYPDVHDIVAVCAAEMPQLVVLDASTAGVEEGHPLDRLEEDKRTKDVPVLVLSEGMDPPRCCIASRGCGIDWMTWPLCATDFLTKVKAMLRVALIDHTSHDHHERDGLTKLYNRRYFDERLEKEIERARRYGRKVSCIMIDIDRFQDLNARFGHKIGDEVLRLLSDIVLSSTRSSDIVARYGGEEFALILPETIGSDAGTVSERLRREFADRVIPTEAGEVTASVSCGVATYPDHAGDAATLVRMADSAVYQAKCSGRNGTVIAFAEQESAEAVVTLSGPTILLVEGNDYSRGVASLVLRASGYEVLEAADGETAISLARQQRPDLVIIDLQIDGMKGLEATKQIVEMEEMKDTPVVALTARDVPGEIEQLVRVGCRGYIVKPIDTNSLASQVQSYLKE